MKLKSGLGNGRFFVELLMLFASQASIGLAYDVTVFRPHDHIRTVDANRDRTALAFLPDLVRIVSDGILPTELFGNAGKRGVKVVQ